VVFRTEVAIGVHWANPLSLLELTNTTSVPIVVSFNLLEGLDCFRVGRRTSYNGARHKRWRQPSA